MSINNAKRRQVGLFVLLLVLAMGCDTADPLVSQEDDLGTSVNPGEAFRVECVMEGESGSFESAGAILDEGQILGDFLPIMPNRAVPAVWTGFRVLRGEKGRIVMKIHSQMAPNNPSALVGRFFIVEATDDYAAITGSGDFQAQIDVSGTLTEVYAGQAYFGDVAVDAPGSTSGDGDGLVDDYVVDSEDEYLPGDDIVRKYNRLCLAKTVKPFSGYRVNLDLQDGISVRANTFDGTRVVFIALDGSRYNAMVNAPAYAGDTRLEVVFAQGIVAESGGWVFTESP